MKGLFEQTLKALEDIFKDLAGFNMSYDEIKDLHREIWKDEDYNNFHVESSRTKSEEL